jgi:hypothetical protein
LDLSLFLNVLSRKNIKKIGNRSIDRRQLIAEVNLQNTPKSPDHPVSECSDRYTLFLFDLCLWLSRDRQVEERCDRKMHDILMTTKISTLNNQEKDEEKRRS